MVIGVGNVLLQDDGVGVALLERVRAATGDDQRIEFIDGGTQGLALLGLLDGRKAALFLDAVGTGATPGTVHRIDDPLGRRFAKASTAHEGNVGELLGVAALLGEVPDRIAVVGIEPAVVRTGLGLSSAVESALPAATEAACRCLDAMGSAVAEAMHA